MLRLAAFGLGLIQTRSSGLLLPVFSLPGPYGIGDLGPAAEAWIDQLAEAGQRYWQVLPLHPVHRHHSLGHPRQ